MAQVKDFGIGPDEMMVRDTARSFLAEHSPVDTLRRLVARDHHESYESAVQPAQWDEGLWGKMVELGWPGLGVPEAAGGVGMEIAGPFASRYLGDQTAPDGGRWPHAYMNSFGFTIAAGSNEIQRNILGERVLGLAKSK